MLCIPTVALLCCRFTAENVVVDWSFAMARFCNDICSTAFYFIFSFLIWFYSKSTLRSLCTKNLKDLTHFACVVNFCTSFQWVLLVLSFYDFGVANYGVFLLYKILFAILEPKVFVTGNWVCLWKIIKSLRQGKNKLISFYAWNMLALLFVALNRF